MDGGRKHNSNLKYKKKNMFIDRKDENWGRIEWNEANSEKTKKKNEFISNN